MPELEQSKLLRHAASKFPEGCLCEDIGECAYCQFITNYLWGRSRNGNEVREEPQSNLCPMSVELNIPIGEPAQISELERIFRLCA